MKQEFEIAVERHNLIVPVGCTGYVAHEIWNTINQDMSAFYTNVDDSLIAAFTKLNTKSDNSSLVNDIISFIKLFKNGKYSKYGNIDQSSTTLRDCPVGAPLLSYFSNLYKSFSKEEKKAVNAFGRWGLYRYYKVTMSYNGASYEKTMLHVISFSVNALPGYDPTV